MTGARWVDFAEFVLALCMAAVWVGLIWRDRETVRGNLAPRRLHPRVEAFRVRLLVLALLLLMSTLVFRSVSDFLMFPATYAVAYGAFVRGMVLIVGVALWSTDTDR